LGVIFAEVVEQPKPQIPPRPVMPPEAAAFLKLKKIKFTLDKHKKKLTSRKKQPTFHHP